jgi:hypothetical protein
MICFDLISIRLFQSNDLDLEFCELTWFTQVFFSFLFN